VQALHYGAKLIVLSWFQELKSTLKLQHPLLLKGQKFPNFHHHHQPIQLAKSCRPGLQVYGHRYTNARSSVTSRTVDALVTGSHRHVEAYLRPASASLRAAIAHHLAAAEAVMPGEHFLRLARQHVSPVEI